MVCITLPDGSRREFDHPVSVHEVARSIGTGLGKAALAGRLAVDGEPARLVDTSHVIDRDASLSIVTDKDAEGLDLIRHSTAHLLAYAVKTLFPDAQVTIGPVIDNGFYYDFSYKRPFTPEDLEAIEKKMAELARRDEAVTREEWDRDEAVKFFRGIGEAYKAEIIASIPTNEKISLYREGDFIDLCRGPHVPSTGRLRVFKLMKVAGAYWRGDSNNEMLQRIYGTAWARKEDQDAYLHMLEQAELRDHRRIGRELDLFHFQDEAPGLIFWHPKGWTVWQQVEQYMRQVYQDNGYQEVKAPQILDLSLWKKTGHWDNYQENMFTTESENRVYGLKPMNCPGHVQIFNAGLHSYRELPLRYGEFGQCHRNEPSGSLHGMMRVRGFTQDEEGLRRLRLHRDPVQGRHPPRKAHRRRRGLGQGRAGPEGQPGPVPLRLRSLGRRGRLLRSEDRIHPEGRHRPPLAVRHHPGGLFHARAPGGRIRRRPGPAPHARDAAPGHPGIPGTLHRHADRKPRRGAARLAGAAPCRDLLHLRRFRRLCRTARPGPEATGPARVRRRAGRKDHP